MNRPAQEKFFSAAAAASVLLLTAACGGGDGATGSTPSSPSASSDKPASNVSYKDGDYTGKGSYPNPGGTSSLTVSLTLKDNTISALEVQPGASSETSAQYQQQFIGGIKGEVVGKKIDSLDVSKVSGSSLTSQGFNQAIDQIKADASA